MFDLTIALLRFRKFIRGNRNPSLRHIVAVSKTSYHLQFSDLDKHNKTNLFKVYGHLPASEADET